MSVNRIASRYAKSLLDLSKDLDQLPRVHEDIQSFKRALENRDLYLLLKSPIVKPDKKYSILQAIFSTKFDKLTMSFIDIVVRKGRESYLPEISKKFLDMYQVLNKVSSVVLKTAKPLSAEQVAEIKTKLEASDISFNDANITTEVDESLIGGFVIEIGDKLYDASVLHKLEKLKKEFSNNDYIKAF